MSDSGPQTSPVQQTVFDRAWLTTRRLGQFAVRVLKRFAYNKGLLLAGSIAYNAFLSLIPLIALVLVGLTYFVSPSDALPIVHAELRHIVGGQQAAILTEEFSAFLDNRHLIGGVGFAVLLFFSSLAFRMLEDAMEIIFAHRPPKTERTFWRAALRPYGFAALIGIALIVLTFFTVFLDRRAPDVTLFGFLLDKVLLYGAGLIGQVLLFSAIYRIMPASHVGFRRALVGGVVAALLWEVTRQFLFWYFNNISLVGVVYGSLATVVIILLSMEVATVIILLGAQVIAELEHSFEHGMRWFEGAPYDDEDDIPKFTPDERPDPDECPDDADTTVDDPDERPPDDAVADGSEGERLETPPDPADGRRAARETSPHSGEHPPVQPSVG